MRPKAKLSVSMTVTQFDNGYWYATELKAFAQRIGVQRASTLRKDELERAITLFLRNGRIENAATRGRATSRTKDVERGLRLTLPVVAYTNDRETKRFLEREAVKMTPGSRRRSGARYRLNRWREEQLARGVRLTYGDVVKEYVRLNCAEQPFAQIPHGRYINFVSDFFAAERGATRAQVIRAWKQLTTLDVPKTYRAWASARARDHRRGS